MQSENDSIIFGFGIPYLILESFRTTMESVGSIVDGKLIGFAVNYKMTFGYTVGITSRHFSGTWTISNIISRIGISYHDIGKRAIGFGKLHSHDSSTERGQCDLGTPGVGEGEQSDFAFRRRGCGFGNFHGVEF
ncbi:unknown [Bacteroides sp. CAG:927]|nr:unknown [Bacteroides sp. CAG:927]